MATTQTVPILVRIPPVKYLVVGAVLLFGAGFGAAWCWGDAKVEALQAFGDSVQVAADARAAAALAHSAADSAIIDSLQKSKRPVTIRISRDSALADSAAQAVAVAKTAADSNVALVVQVAALKTENAGLRQNARTDSLSVFFAVRRGDSLQVALTEQTKAIADLNRRIQQLTPRTPKWVKAATYVVTAGAGFYAGVRCVKSGMCP
jgi:hypothetical protein